MQRADMHGTREHTCIRVERRRGCAIISRRLASRSLSRSYFSRSAMNFTKTSCATDAKAVVMTAARARTCRRCSAITATHTQPTFNTSYTARSGDCARLNFALASIRSRNCWNASTVSTSTQNLAVAKTTWSNQTNGEAKTYKDNSGTSIHVLAAIPPIHTSIVGELGKEIVLVADGVPAHRVHADLFRWQRPQGDAVDHISTSAQQHTRLDERRHPPHHTSTTRAQHGVQHVP